MSEQAQIVEGAAKLTGFIEATGCPLKVISDDSDISEAEISRMRTGKKLPELLQALKIGRAIGRWESRAKRGAG